MEKQEKKRIWKYLLVGGVSTLVILLFSLSMSMIAGTRNQIAYQNYLETSNLYNGELKQVAANVNRISKDSSLFNILNIPVQDRDKKSSEFLKNANIIKTDAAVTINADFVKKGLEYQPTYQTEFSANYVMRNDLNEDSIVAFEFPFPFSAQNNEISDVTLFVNGVEQTNSKAKLTVNGAQVDGLRWEGKVKAKEDIELKVSYSTVGVARFAYQGFANNLSKQDFKLDLKINGTRAYDIVSGLSKDKIEFGTNSVRLTWDKKNLFSTPEVNVLVADKLAPSEQVSRVYLAMTPIYVAFIGALIWVSFKHNKPLRVKDMLIATGLYAVYFPLLHYLASFTIDPTMEIFAGVNNVGYFSLSLYAAFGIAILLIGGLLYYLFSVAYSRKYALTAVLPAIVLFLGYFPFVLTIPEYSLLLALVGTVMLAGLFIQMRLKESR